MSTLVSTLQTALTFYELGIAVIPCAPRSKFPRGAWRRWQSELPTLDHLLAWFQGPNNLAVVTGHSGLAVLDFDTVAVYELWLLWAAVAWPVGAFLTYRVFTARGVHVYVYCPEARAQKIAGLGDLKARGGYVIGADSVHPSGVIYTAQPGPIVRAAIDELLPAALIAPPPLPPTEYIAPKWLAPGDGDLLQRARAAIRIEDYFGGAEKTGDGWLLDYCPFHTHPSNRPSFWINTAKQICGCYSGCNGGRVMDGINFYAAWHGVTNGEAIRELGGFYNVNGT